MTATTTTDESAAAEPATAGPQSRGDLRLACEVAKIADGFKARNTVVLDMRSSTPLFDFFVVCTGGNRRQMHAIAEDVDDMMADQGSKRLSLEGYRESIWILQDYGDIVLHVFEAEARELYDLEGLWAEAKPVDWRAELGLPPEEESLGLTEDSADEASAPDESESPSEEE